MSTKEGEILTSIRSKILPLGFKELKTDSHDFSTAFIRKGVITSMAFLINDSDSIRPNDIPHLISNAHLWCKQNLKSKWIVKESGLNLILLHKGTITQNDIKGYTAKTGVDKAVIKSGAILQSITAVNTIDLSVFQSKTWAVLGKIDKVLKRIQEIP